MRGGRASLERSSYWLEWPWGTVRVGVVFLVAVTLVAVVVAYPGVIQGRDDRAAENSALSYADREVAGGNGLVVDQQALYQARGRISRGDTYKVVVSPGYQGGGPLTVPYVASYYRYFLMPRRPAENPRWIICYGCDLKRYRGVADVVWRDVEGIAILKIRR